MRTTKLFIYLFVVVLVFSSIAGTPIATAKTQALTKCSDLKLGDNIKANLKNAPAIWNIGADNKLRPFLDGDDFKTWHEDNLYEGHYKTVTPQCVASYKTANSFPLYVGRRPGSGLIKQKGSSQLYAILPNNTKAPVTTEAAKALYGSNYKVRTVDFASFHNYYNSAAKISGKNPQPHAGMFIKKDNTKYYVNSDNNFVKITEQDVQVNKVKTDFIKTIKHAISLINTGSLTDSLKDYAQTLKAIVKSVTNNSISTNTGSVSGGDSSSSGSSNTESTSSNSSNSESTNTSTNESTSSNTGSTTTSTQTNNNTSSNTSSNTSGSSSTSTESSTSTSTQTNTTTEEATETEVEEEETTTTTEEETTTETQTNSTGGTTYYVRTDGGTATQCNGKSNTAYSGSSQNCAWKHPFIALPPEGSAGIAGGDTLIIANGSYKMGFGASAGAESCSQYYPWDCNMPSVPSGPSASQPTRILGANYASGCSSKPQLYGAERTHSILDLSDSSNIEVQCLEITDRLGCVEFHSGSIACNRDSYPYGNWASTGIIAEDSSNVLLKNLDIHGLASAGVRAGRLTNWTIDNTKIVANGWVGWDGDIDGNDSNSGTMTFNKVNIDWNGCGETYPGKQPTGCWGQSAGGYGDGLGTGDTGGNWIFTDSTFLHNTSDGLDMLYHRSGGKVTVTRVHAEGNAGNQVKTTGSADITDSVIIGNCSYFSGKSFTHNVDNCRALGNAISIEPSGSTVNIYNNSVYSNGDGLLYSGSSGTVNIRNNIFYAGTDYHQPSETSFYIYSEGGTTFVHDYNLVYNAKSGNGICSDSSNNICGSDPLFSSVGSSFDLRLQSGSPAIGTGTTPLTSLDFTSKSRPSSGIDMGAYER